MPWGGLCLSVNAAAVPFARSAQDSVYSLCRTGKSPADRGARLAKVQVAVSRLSFSREAPAQARSYPAASSPAAFSEAAAEVGGKNFPFLVTMEVLLITTKTSVSEPALQIALSGFLKSF